MRWKTPALAICGLMAATPGLATAELVVPDVYAYQRSVHEQYYTTYSYGPGSIGSVNGAASGGGSPYAHASAEAQTGWGYSSYYQYYFKVEGAGDNAVPLIAKIRLSAIAAGNDNARAYAMINFNGNNYSLYTNSVDHSLSYIGTITSSIFSYNLGSITLEAGTDTQYGGTASAFADPLVIIDPAYAEIDPDYLQHLTLTFSSGVVNASAVPEPATWALLLTGFGMIGNGLRRQRRATA